MGTFGTESPLRLQVSSCLKTLSTSRDSGEIVHALRTLMRCLDDGEFTRIHHTHALQVLVSAQSSHWFSRSHDEDEEEMKKLWGEIIIRGPAEQTLLTLLDTISSTGESEALDRCVSALEMFLSAARLQVLLWSRCEVSGASADSPQLTETVIGHLAALPSITSNHLHTNTPDIFLPQQYYPLLAASILDTLEKTCHALRAGRDCSLGFVSQVLGKVCIQGYSSQMFETLGPRLSFVTREDALYQRVTQKLMENVPERCTESVITGLIRSLSGAAAVSRLMGNLVLTNKKAQFVLTHKLILQQYQHPTRLLKSVLGYLAVDSSRRPLLKQIHDADLLFRHIPGVLCWIECWWLWGPFECSGLVVMFGGPVWGDSRFVAWSVVLLEVAIGGWVRCGHGGMDMVSNGAQVGCGVDVVPIGKN